jgi:hypothetical protein
MLSQRADLDSRSMSPGTARKLLELSFSRANPERAGLLARKAQDGALTASEQDELDEYIRVADLLAILQSRARRALRRSGGSS